MSVITLSTLVVIEHHTFTCHHIGEVKGRHAVYVSKPEAVAALIDKAARAVKVAGN